MGGKRLDDDDVSTWSSQRRSAYERGAADTHERYAAMQAQAREWLANVLGVIGRLEAHGNPTRGEHIARELREALSLDPAVTISCPCAEHSPHHTQADFDASAASTGTSEDVEALAKALAEHRAVFQCDGDYGEMQWVECTCGSDYYVDTDAGYAEHEAHLAAVLAAREAAARAEEAARIAREG